MSEFDTSNKTLSIIGFVTAIIGVVLIAAYFILYNVVAGFPAIAGLIFLIAGAVLSIVGMITSIASLAKRVGNKVFAIIGLILGIMGILFLILALALTLGFIVAAFAIAGSVAA